MPNKHGKVTLKLKGLENTRLKLDKKSQRKVSKLYEDLAGDLSQQINDLKGKDNISSAMKRINLKGLLKETEQELNKLNIKMNNDIKKSISDVSEQVVNAIYKFNKNVGFDFGEKYSYIPKQVVKSIVNGDIYEGGWNLSSRIWGINNKVLSDIHLIVSKGIANNSTVYDIAKDIEKYVKPSAKLPWDWSKCYPGTNLKIDYNAQRLVRTLSQHAYQQSLLLSTKDNPWINKYKWISNGSRVCPLCRERNGKIYTYDNLPLDHPNGMCVIEPVLDKSLEEIGDEIADWYNSPEGTYPDIDKYSKNFN